MGRHRNGDRRRRCWSAWVCRELAAAERRGLCHFRLDPHRGLTRCAGAASRCCSCCPILASGTAYIILSSVVGARRVTTLSLLAVPVRWPSCVGPAGWAQARGLAVGFRHVPESRCPCCRSLQPVEVPGSVAAVIMVRNLVANQRWLVARSWPCWCSAACSRRLAPPWRALAIILGTVIWQALASWARALLGAWRSQILILAVVGSWRWSGVVVAPQVRTTGEHLSSRTIAQSSSSAGLSVRPPQAETPQACPRTGPGVRRGVKPHFGSVGGQAGHGRPDGGTVTSRASCSAAASKHCSGLMDMWAAASPGGLLLLLIAGTGGDDARPGAPQGPHGCSSRL